jgi:hypothetical protein
VRFHQIKKVLQSKINNYQSKEKVYRIRANICHYFFDRELFSVIYNELINTKSKNNTINKYENEMNGNFSKYIKVAIKYMKNLFNFLTIGKC